MKTEMQDFMDRANIDWKTSSPHHAPSNGGAEHAVGMVKTIMKKAIEEDSQWRDTLYILQSTPRTPEGMSPARLFFQRQLCIPHLPTLPDSREEQYQARLMLKKKTKAKQARN